MLVINVINDQNVNIYHIVSEVQENKTETIKLGGNAGN